MDSLRKHNVYKMVKMSSVPKEEKIIGSRFVFKQKVDGRFIARLVVQGYVQEAEVDTVDRYRPPLRHFERVRGAVIGKPQVLP